MTDAVKIAAYAARLDPQGYEKGAERVTAANDRMGKSTEGLEKQQEKQQARMAASERSVDSLIRKYDEQARREHQRATEIDRVSRAFDQGNISADKHARAIELIDRQYSGSVRQANTFADASRNSAERVRQVGFQLQDFAIQVQSGTSAFVAFSQQGGQLAQALLGPAAALAVTVVGIGAMIAKSLLWTDATEDTAEAQKKLVDALKVANELERSSADRSRENADAKRIEAANTNALALALERENVSRREAAEVLGGGTRARTQGAKDLVQAFHGEELTAEQARIANLVRSFETLNSTANRSTTELIDDLAELRAGFSPTTDALKKYTEANQLLHEAEQSGLITREEYARLLEKVKQRFEDATGPAKAYYDAIAKGEEAFAQVQAEADKATNDYIQKQGDKEMRANPGERMRSIGANWEQASDGEKSEYLRFIESNIQAYEEGLREQQVGTRSHAEETSKIRDQHRAAEQKAEEMFQQDLQEAQKATNDYLIAEQKRVQEENFGAGAMTAVTDYFDNLAKHGKRASDFITNSVFRPMEDALTKFFATGKFKIGDFFNSMKMGIARLAAQDLIGTIGGALGFGSGGGGGGSLIGGAISGIGSFVGGLFGLRDGGRPTPGVPVLVGEAGPEIVTFDRPATVHSNSDSRMMATNVAGMGQGRDNILVHLMTEELPILRRVLGPGKLNPRTGLLGFESGVDSTGGPDPGGAGVAGTSTHDIGSMSNDARGAGALGDTRDVDDYDMEGARIATELGLYDMGLLDTGVRDPFSGLGRVGAARAMGDEPSLMDHIADLMGGLFGLGLQGFVGGLLGGPIGFMAANVIGGLRSSMTGGRAIGAGFGGMVADALEGRGMLGAVISGEMSLGEAISSTIDRAVGSLASIGDRLSGMGAFGGAFAGGAGRFGGFDQTGSMFGIDALSASRAERTAGARMDLAADFAGFRDSLDGSWASVERAGANVMASSAPGFNNGGAIVRGPGGPDSLTTMVRLSPNERADFTPAGQPLPGTPDLAPLVRTLRGGQRMDAVAWREQTDQIVALRKEMATLSRRISRQRAGA